MKAFVFSIIAVVVSVNLFAQPVTGNWYGTLKTPKKQIHIVFHLNKNEKGYDATMDSPDQNAFGIKTDTAIVDGNNIDIEVKAMGMKYVGVFDSSLTACKGVFHQGTAEVPLVLTRTAEETKVVVRPQDPVNIDYYQEEVTIKNVKDSVTLSGTLTLPKDRKATKIVILITGSGPQNRNEEIKTFNHRPFLVWSDELTRHGIGVLRYDDRGIGKSTGNFGKSTSADFANDVTSAVDFIKSRSDLKEMQLGLMGHSEGGMIAPMVASKDKRIDFIVLLAGPGVPINELMVKQTESSQSMENVPKEIGALNLETARLVYKYMKENAAMTNEKIEPGIRKVLLAQLAKYPEDAMKGTSVDAIADKEMKSYMSAWFRYFVAFEPASYLVKVKCPVLAINGTLDMQVDAVSNLHAIDAALKKGKNKDYRIVPMGGLNHLFQKATTGSTKEYGEIAETVNPAAMDVVVKWICDHN